MSHFSPELHSTVIQKPPNNEANKSPCILLKSVLSSAVLDTWGLFVAVPPRKFCAGGTEEYTHFSGFLDAQQQLWSGSSVFRTPECILWVCQAHPYSTCRARQRLPGSIGAIKHAAHRQSACAKWIHGVHGGLHRNVAVPTPLQDKLCCCESGFYERLFEDKPIRLAEQTWCLRAGILQLSL